MKAFTDLEQSEKLAEILPIESADMAYYQWKDDGHLMSPVPFVLDGMEEKEDGVFKYIPCWSLASLLDVLPKIINNETLFIETSAALWHIGYRNIYTARADNPIDACVAMIEKLHELNLL